MIPAELLQYATDRQREIAEAINEHGGAPQAAKVLGVNRSYVTRAMQALERKAIAAGCRDAEISVQRNRTGRRCCLYPE